VVLSLAHLAIYCYCYLLLYTCSTCYLQYGTDRHYVSKCLYRSVQICMLSIVRDETAYTWGDSTSLFAPCRVTSLTRERLRISMVDNNKLHVKLSACISCIYWTKWVVGKPSWESTHAYVLCVTGWPNYE